MNWLKFTSLEKQSNINETISGPEVDSIINTVKNMFNRGAPTEYDFQGFNKIDYNSWVLQEINNSSPGSAISIKDLDYTTKRLLYYRRQIPEAEQLRQSFEQKVNSLSGQDQQTQGDKTVKILGPGSYGKTIIYIPDSAQLPKIKLNRALREKAHSLGWKEERDQFGGFGYPLWKAFSGSKTQINTFEVLPEFLPTVGSVLKPLGYDVSALMFETPKITNPQSTDPQEKQQNPQQMQLKAKGVEDSENFVISFDWHTTKQREFVVEFKQFVSSLKITSLRFDGGSKKWEIGGLKKSLWSQLENFFKQNGYTTEFPQATADDIQQESMYGMKLKVINVSGKGPYHIAFHSPSGRTPEIIRLKEQIEEMTKFSFPLDAAGAEDRIGNHIFDAMGRFTGGYSYYHCIKGDFNDYVSFAEILRKKGFDLTDYRKILLELIQSGKITKDKADGILDGYLKKDETGNYVRYPANYPDRHKAGKFIEDIDKFYEDLDQYTIKKPGKPPAKPLDPQKECMKHLYTRRSALNGSETGSGKTIIFIAAADMRIKKDGGGRILVVTENGPKQQLIREIESITGDKIADNAISEDPSVISKWTVMHYNQFGADIDGGALEAKNKAALKYISKAIEYARGLQDQNTSNMIVKYLKEHFDGLPKLSIEDTGFDVDKLEMSDQIFKEFDIFNQYINEFAQMMSVAKQSFGNGPGIFKLFESVENYIDVQKEKMSVFRRMKQGAELVRLISEQNFKILVLDECHNVKNDSNQSNNILRVAQNIPIKWGGSATISANKPIDVYRQLKAIGHNLGKLSPQQFNDHFVGNKQRKITLSNGQEIAASFDPTDINSFFKHLRKRVENSIAQWEDRGARGEFPRDVATVTDLDDETILKIADKELKPHAMEQVKKVMNLTAWLTLTDVYMSKTKEDINPDIPEHIVSDEMINPDFQETQTLDMEVERMKANFKDPGLVVSEMLAYRKKMAEIKTKYTLSQVAPVLRAGKKALIFTCFRESAKMLYNGLQGILNQTGKVATLAMEGEDAKARQAKVDLFKNPNGTSQALILGILSGGTGIDIPNVTDQVFINDFDWTPKAATQSEGRAYRVNAEFPVNTRYMVLRNTPDVIFYKQVQKKKNLARFIQKMDKEFIDKVNNNGDTSEILARCQQEQWNVITSQIKEKISMMRWLLSGGKTAHNWIGNFLKKGLVEDICLN